jgi:polyphenol oxidase
MKGSLPVVRPAIFRHVNIVAGMSTREGGVSPDPLGLNLSLVARDSEKNVRENRDRFCGECGVSPTRLARMRQVHGNTVCRVDAPGVYAECDALLTNVSNLFLCVSVADCVPILLYDHNTETLAAIHAGWRGTAADIVRHTVATMVDENGTDPRKVFAYVGPSAGSCCYKVNHDVSSRFDEQFVREDGGSIYVDLKSANRHQLIASELLAHQIEMSDECTICDTRFHSHRRDGAESGRMMAMIGSSAAPEPR